jgi:Family of unknown function (DUF6228)
MLDALLRVSSHYATGFNELVRFFREFAADWRGWPGERTYESLEHELRLARVTMVTSVLRSSCASPVCRTGGRPLLCSASIPERR